MANRHYLSFSGGKDSTFLLLELLRRKYPLDEVVFFDTGWEFPAMYEHIEKIKQICSENGIEFVALHPPKDFDYLMLEHVTNKGNVGYSWCGGNSRWGTAYKTQTLDKYSQQNKGSVVLVVIHEHVLGIELTFDHETVRGETEALALAQKWLWRTPWIEYKEA